ncbi:MAG: glycosyltransferase [Rubinisphaera brasiliensis]|uniref:glycosyltransferase n=1 Tax=Rubinisphaera brasiliensis TaxID=119 RepID=UPI00391C05A9
MYIQMFSVHGLLRGSNFELGRDADTGGQIRYVVEMAKQLAEHDEVEGVDLFTRMIEDGDVDDTYREEIERLSDKARIIRVPCGEPRYERKELLWPWLDEFVENVIAFNEDHGNEPTALHGHYADAGYVARKLAEHYQKPLIFTGHSLGKPKLDYLLEQDWSHERANEILHIDHRIEQEQETLNAADLVICSTTHERDEQYGQYETPRTPLVVPPGTDLNRFYPPAAGETYETRLTEDIRRFLTDPDKPWLLAVARPDRRKNLQGLVRAFGSSPELREKANLVIVAGNRDAIGDLPDNEQQVFTELLMLQDEYNLYGQLALPKTHDSETEIPDLYRYVAVHEGIFINSAFIELFGLTAIESAACGLPFVATQEGGPTDIVANCCCGLTINTSQNEEIQNALLKLLNDRAQWRKFAESGPACVKHHYSWETHCQRYVEEIHRLLEQPAKVTPATGEGPGGGAEPLAAAPA